MYYLLAGFPIQVPALRNRKPDIIGLANFFLKAFIKRNKIKNLIFTQEAKNILLEYSFPGNVRELKTIVEASALNTNNSEIGKDDLLIQNPPNAEEWLDEELTLEGFTHKIIYHYLEKHDNDVLLVAKKLNIGKSTIYRILKANKKT